MASDHFSKYLNDAIEIIIFTDGGISITDIENMSADELPYFIYNFKQYHTEKQKLKGDTLKGILDFARQHIEVLFKLLAGRK